MALDPRDQIIMRDAFYDALNKWNKGGGFGGGASPSSPSPPGGNPFEGVGKAAVEGVGKAAGKVFDNVAGTVKGVGSAALDLTGKLARGGLTVTDATRTLESGLKLAGGAGSGLATALGKGVGAFGDIVQYVEEGVDVFRDLSKTGATFNNSVVDMRAAAAGSRMTLNEFSDIIKTNGANLSALGGNAANGAKEFAKLSKGFFDSGLGDKLTQLGYTSEDLNKLMAIQLTNVSARELKERGGVEAQYQSTVRLAEEMDMMAKIQGKSRTEQEKELEAAKADGQKQSAIQLEILNGNKKAGEAFDAVAGSTSGQFGKLVQEMVSSGRPLTEENRKYAGMLSKETQAAIQEARDAYKKGDVEGAREAAKRAQALEAADVATNKSRLALGAQGVEVAKKSFEDQGKYGKILAEKAKDLGTDIRDPKAIAAAQKALEDDAKKAQEVRSGETASVIEAQNRIKDMGSAIQESIIVPLKDKANKEVLNDFYKSLKNANQSIANGGTATSKQGFSGDLQSGINKVTEELRKTLERSSSTTGPQQKFSSEDAKATNQAQAEALKKAVISGRSEMSKDDANGIKSLNNALKSVDGEAVSKQLEKIAKDQNKSTADVLSEAVNKPGGIGNLTKQLSEDAASKKILADAATAVKKQQSASDLTKTSEQKGRNTAGTSADALKEGVMSGLDSLGSLTTKTIDMFKVEGGVNIEGKPVGGGAGFADGGVSKGPDSGYYALLHGEETVIPNKDIDAVVGGAISKLPIPKAPGEEKSFAENMAADVRKGMQTVGVNPDTGKQAGLDLKTISKDISTTISSVKGGGSTTTRSVQNEESKAASKELASVKEQYAAERKALLEKTKEQLGPDAKPRHVLNAMRNSDETKALEEKYNALMDPLEKKIEAGIVWETETKEAAVEEAKKAVEEELAAVKIGNQEQLSLKKLSNEETKKITEDELAAVKFANEKQLSLKKLNEDEIAKVIEDAGHDVNDFYVDMNGDLKAFAGDTLKSIGDGLSNIDSISNKNFEPVDISKIDIPTIQSSVNKVTSSPMPSSFNEIRTSAADMQAQWDKEKQEKKRATESVAKKATDNKNTDSNATKDDKKTAPAAKAASSTLDDVVTALNQLNKSMNTLLAQSEILGKKQIKASKSSGSSNIYDRI